MVYNWYISSVHVFQCARQAVRADEHKDCEYVMQCDFMVCYVRDAYT